MSVEIIRFPPYIPTEAERNNPDLYALNVRRIMYEGTNLKSEHKLELATYKFQRAKKINI
jgi:hypothetical protein